MQWKQNLTSTSWIKLHANPQLSHNTTGKIVRYASKKRKLLDKLSVNELQKFEKNITKDVFKVLSPINSMKTKSSFGGTSPENVKKSIQYAIKKYLWKI